MMMLRNLIQVIIVVAAVGNSESCSCHRVHKQEYFCKADFVLQVHVRDEEIIYKKTEVIKTDPISGKNLTEILRHPVSRNYNMRIRKVFKIKKNKLGLTRNSTVATMQTPYYDATCGVKLQTRRKYITAGHFYQDQLSLNLCGWVEPWKNLSKVQKRNLRSLYETNCDCKIVSKIVDRQGENEYCEWDSFSDDSECYDRESACVHNKNTVLGECKWQRNNKVKACRKEVKRRKWEP